MMMITVDNLSSLRFQRIYSKLSPSFAINDSQIRSCYRSFYDKLLESYNNNDFIRITSLLKSMENKNIVPNFVYPPTEEDPSQDTFLKDFAQLLYKIITIYPVKYYNTQSMAAEFLLEFLSSNKQIPGLILDWQPFYKVLNYYLNNNISKFLSGRDFLQGDIELLLSSRTYVPFSFLDLEMKISRYFPDEYETKTDGLIVKTNTTKQLVKKFIPYISTNVYSRSSFLMDFNSFVPPYKNRYKEFIEFLLFLLKDPKSFKNESILQTLNEVISVNIEDDFSYLFPILSQLISDQILTHQSFLFLILSEILISLFISPPTRQEVLDLLESFFISFKSICHPSIVKKRFSGQFIENIVTSLRKGLKKLKSNKKNKIYFKMDEKLGPSQDDIHRLLSMTSEINIMNIRNCFNSTVILIETTLDPLLIDRYFEIAVQCIDLTDAYGVARSGWTILTALIMSIDKSEKLRRNFETIFQIATNNLYRSELQLIISNFLVVSLMKVPFNRENTLKGLENTDFCKLAFSYFSNLLTILRSLPAANGENAQTNYMFESSVVMCSDELFKNCEPQVFDELLPVFTSLAFDEDITHCASIVELIVTNYCYYSKNFENANKIVKAFQKNFENSCSNLTLYRYLSVINATVLTVTKLSKEAVRETVDLLLPNVKNENEKIRKATWRAIHYALSIFNRIINARVTLKSDKIVEYALENAKFEDFDIKFKPKPSLIDLDFEIYDAVFNKLLEMKDQYELNTYLNEIGNDLAIVIQNSFQFSEGSKDQINELYDNSIFFVPELIEKSIPFKDKFFKCMIRIILDFPENENLICQVLQMLRFIFDINYNTSIYLISSFFIPFDQSGKNYNSEYLYDLLINRNNKRKELFLYPLTSDIRRIFELVVELTINNSKEIRSKSSAFLSVINPYYSPLINSLFEKIFEKKESIPINVFVSFLSLLPDSTILLNNDHLFCDVILFILKKFESNIKDKDFLDDLKSFLSISLLPPFETPSNDNKEYNNLLNEIEKNYLNKSNSSRSFTIVLLDVIICCLKRVYNISDNILEFIIKCVTHYDHQISGDAEICLSNVLERRAKFTKERIDVTKQPTISSIPNILDKIKVTFPQNGYFFPTSKNEENIEENDRIQETFSADYSIDINPTNSIDINFENTEVNDEIVKVFESFKNVEIEWIMTEEEKFLFDSEYFFDQSNGFLKFKDHYHHKKYEFNENKMLLENIPNIFASAINSINENNLQSSVQYSIIWKYYALTVGPFCTRKLAKISRKYLSEYFAMSPEVTSKILYDMILGFLKNICYWNIEDRIEFFKLVALPVICVISTSPNLSKLIRFVIREATTETSPYCISPLIKILFDLSQKEENGYHYNRCLFAIISTLILNRQIFFFNSIDQINDKFISPFLDKMHEYKMNELFDISYLLFCIFDCISFIDKKSPLYSSEIEEKTIKFTSIYNSILHKENKNDCLIYFLTNSFKFFSSASYNSRLLIAPVLIDNLHVIFNLLKKSRISNEESFVQSFREFIENDIFFAKDEMKFIFLSNLIKELMKAPLPLQQILLENVNNMLESNIFNINKKDYNKYEDLFINYSLHEKSMNLGNELRLKIAKILGIFEIRKNSLKKSNVDLIESSEKVDDIEILKAASIILNAYLFDRVDKRVTDALEIMERLSNKNERGSKNKIFFKSVLEIFIQRHSEHVINEVEDILIQYKYMMAPSYIC